MTLWSFRTCVCLSVFTCLCVCRRNRSVMAAAFEFYSLWQSEAAHGEKDSHACGVAVIWERIKSNPSLTRVYHPHAAAHLYYELAFCWLLILQIGYFMVCKKGAYFIYFFISHSNSWPLRIHIDALKTDYALLASWIIKSNCTSLPIAGGSRV